MGLFSKKGPCPICGGKISWFIPTKLDGEAICDTCADKIDLPYASSYLIDYQKKCKEIEQIVDANAIRNPRVQYVQLQGDAIEEIKRYKGLMEEGIILEEEFNAKKRQLLGV